MPACSSHWEAHQDGGMDETRFRELLPKMAADALASGSPQNNPRVPTAEEIVGLYEQAW